MERNGLPDHNPFESSAQDDSPKNTKESKKNKRKANPETPHTEKKHKVERDIGRSLEHLALFDTKEDKKDSTTSEADDRSMDDSVETKPESESELVLDQLSEAEVQQTQQTIAQDHLEALNEQEQEEESSEVMTPARDFLQQVAEGISLEEAYRQAAERAGIDTESPALNTQPPVTEVAQTIDPSVPSEGEIPLYRSPEPDEPPTTAGVEGHEDDERPLEPPTAGAGGNGNGERPPEPPAAGEADDGGSGNNNDPHVPRASRPLHFEQPTASRAAIAPELPPVAERFYHHRHRNADVLAAGITGFLIGRRRGRIKSERKLLPVQHKLEHQVRQLETDITQKEQQLIIAQATVAPQPRLRIERTSALKPRVEQTRVSSSAEQSSPVVLAATREKSEMTAVKRPEKLAAKPQRAEQLGHLLVTAETPTPVRTEVRFEKPKNIRQAFAQKMLSRCNAVNFWS